MYLEHLGAFALGLALGAVSGYTDVDGAHKRAFLAVLAFVGLGGLATVSQTTDEECREDAGVAIGEPAPQCELIAWGAIMTVAAFVFGCVFGYGMGQEWASRRKARNSG